jgi:hypothetical protein
LNQNWKYYVIEFLVIVAGITVSFLISEWSSERDDRQHEIRILSNLERDLAMDTTVLGQEARELREIIVFLDWMLQAEAESMIDSIPMVLESMLSYSRVSIHQSTYQEITHAGGAQYLSNKDILGSAVNYYSNQVGVSNELVHIGKNYVLNQVMPFIQTKVPAIIAIGDSTRRQEFITAFESDEFRNHILFSRSWKTQQAGESERLSQITDSTLMIIKAEVSRLNDD